MSAKLLNKVALIAVATLTTTGAIGAIIMTWMLFYLGPHSGWLSERFLWWQIRIFPATFGALICAGIICRMMNLRHKP